MSTFESSIGEVSLSEVQQVQPGCAPCVLTYMWLRELLNFDLTEEQMGGTQVLMNVSKVINFFAPTVYACGSSSFWNEG